MLLIVLSGFEQRLLEEKGHFSKQKQWDLELFTIPDLKNKFD